MEERDFTEGGFYKASSFFWNLVLANVFFLITNLPSILVIIFAPFLTTVTFTLAISGSMIIGAPGAVALFSVMDKLFREKDINPAKDFFKAYKIGFIQSLAMGALIIVVINILYVDMIFFTGTGIRAINYIITALIIYLALVLSYAYAIIGKFYLRLRDVLALSMYYSLRRFPITLANGAVILFLLWLILNVSIFFSFIGFSLAAYAIMFLQRGMLKLIEEKLSRN